MKFNPQTFVRVKRNALKQIAIDIGNAALQHQRSWPASGDGRAVKDAAEEIYRNLSGDIATENLKKSVDEIEQANVILRRIRENTFFRSSLSSHLVALDGERYYMLGNNVNIIISDVDYGILKCREGMIKERSVAEQFANIVPEQSISPLRFEFRDGKIRLRHQTVVADVADRESADKARDELIAQGEGLIAAFQDLNFDWRLRDTILDMHERIVARQDIIRLGVAAVTCQMIIDASIDEVPAYWVARLRGYSVSIGMFAAQHTEWAQFSEKSALVDLTTDEIRKVYETGSRLAEELRKAPELVDPEVPRSMLLILEGVKNPKRAVKRTVYASITSIANMVSVVAKHLGSMIASASSGISEGLKPAAKHIAYAGLLTIAGNAAVNLSSSTTNVIEAKWLKYAGKAILDAVKTGD